VDVRAHRHGRFGAEQLDCYGWLTTGNHGPEVANGHVPQPLWTT